MEETAAQVAVMMPISCRKGGYGGYRANQYSNVYRDAPMVTPSAEAEEALATAAAMVAEAEAAAWWLRCGKFYRTEPVSDPELQAESGSAGGGLVVIIAGGSIFITSSGAVKCNGLDGGDGRMVTTAAKDGGGGGGGGRRRRRNRCLYL